MKLPDQSFTVTDWTALEPVRYPGTTGFANWRTASMGDIRLRLLTYSPDYLADHWCDIGHIALVLSGSIVVELKDGRSHTLTKGMSFQVSSDGDAAHRLYTAAGADVFLMD